jgi:hypothetical protein
MTIMSDTIASALVQWKGRLKAYLLSKSLVGVPTVVTLLEDIDDIITSMDTPEEGGLTLNDVHTIDRLGCGLAVLSMYCDGMDTSAIARAVHTQTGMEISGQEVQKWVNTYEQSGVVRRSTMTNLSIFDTKSRMEDILMMLQTTLSEVEAADESEFSRAKTTRYEVKLAAIGQIRSSVKDARQVIEALHQMNTYRELADIILQEIRMESPSAQQRIMRRLKEKGAIIKAIMPAA